MLFLIGGAPRTGKSKLADRMLLEIGAAPLHTDLVVETIRRASPRVLVTRRFDPKFDIRERTTNLNPFLVKEARDLLLLHDNVAMEGELVSPRYVKVYQHKFGPNNVRAVFLTSSHPNLATILKHEGRSGWVRRESAERQEQFLRWFKERSDLCVREAKKSGAKVFDTSRGYDRAQQAAFRYLTRGL